jgi:hypothetical protein
MSRPTKLTEATVQILCESAKLGLKVDHMCERAQIKPRTYYAWKSKAKQGEEPFFSFMQRVEKSKADGVAHNLAIILRAAKEDRSWTAAAWILERCFGYNKVIENIEEEVVLDVDEIDVKELLRQLEKSHDELKQFMLPDVKE